MRVFTGRLLGIGLTVLLQRGMCAKTTRIEITFRDNQRLLRGGDIIACQGMTVQNLPPTHTTSRI